MVESDNVRCPGNPRDVETQLCGGIDLHCAHCIKCSAIGWILDEQRVEVRINVVKNSSRRTHEIVRIGGTHHGWIGPGMWVGCGKLQVRVGCSDSARVRVEAQILVRIARDPDSIYRRIKIKAETGPV